VSKKIDACAYNSADVRGLDWCSFRAGYHTQVPEISGKLSGKKISFHMGHITFAALYNSAVVTIYPHLCWYKLLLLDNAPVLLTQIHGYILTTRQFFHIRP
jgi:hypothetical protein